jgi:hypothetical protein
VTFTLRLGARGGESLDQKRLAAWAAARRHFPQAGVGRYHNEITGVYFTLALEKGSLSVDINYNRPTYFGAEAVEALEPLCTELDLAVSDPQGVAGPAAFDADALLASYVKGNTYAAKALAAVDAAQPAVMARADALALWRYRKLKNGLEAELQEEMSEEYLVPDLIVVAHEGRALRVAFIPRPTYYVLPPAELLLFKRGETTCVAHASEVLSRIGGLFKTWKAHPDLRISTETVLFDSMDEWDAALDSVPLAFPPSGLQRLALDAFIDE